MFDAFVLCQHVVEFPVFHLVEPFLALGVEADFVEETVEAGVAVAVVVDLVQRPNVLQLFVIDDSLGAEDEFVEIMIGDLPEEVLLVFQELQLVLE